MKSRLKKIMALMVYRQEAPSLFMRKNVIFGLKHNLLPKIGRNFSTERQLSQIDLDNLKTLSDQAQTYSSKQEYSNAREALKKSADLLKRIYGEKNLDYARVLKNIGINYKIQRKFNEAIQSLTKCADVLSSLKGDNQNEKAYALGELGKIYTIQKNYEKAYNYLKEATQILSKNKLKTMELVSLFDALGNVQKERGNLEKSVEAYQHSIKIFEQFSDRQTTESLQTLNELGRCYMKLQKYSEALEIYQRIYEIEDTRQNKKTLNIASALINIALVYKKMNKHQDYFINFEKGLNMVQETLGNTHKDFSPLAQDLGISYFQHGQLQKSLQLLQKCLANIFNMNKQERQKLKYGTILTVIANIHRKKLNYSESLKNFQLALQIFEVDNKNAYYTASILNYMGEILLIEQLYESSLQHFIKSLKILETINGKKSIKNIGIYYNIVAAYEKMGKKQEIQNWGKQIQSIRKSQKV